MATGHFLHHDGSTDPYLMHGDMNLYDTSSESSASSPLNSNTFDHVYGTNDHVYGGNTFMPYPTFPIQYQPNGIPMGLIPVELDIEGIYEDHDRRRRKNLNGNEKVVASHVHSRRRAQNRASQRAFRDRKEKHMRELEQRLEELEGRHNDLSRSYESLQVEYSGVKQELNLLRKERTERSVTGSPKEFEVSNVKDWEESKVGSMDPLLFDVSAFCFDQDESGVQSKE